jgi:uncharacterized protein
VVSPNITFTSCIGIEDGPFLPRRLGGTRAPLMIVKLKGPHMTRARAGWITVDGMDGTERALELLSSSRSITSCPILLGGVTFGGFNLIDPRRLQKRFKTPTIVVVGFRPDNRAVKSALVKHFPDWRKRWGVIRALGPLRSVRTMASENPIFYEAFGCSSGVARKILTSWAFVSRVPEPLRVAGLIARGLFPAQPLG